MTTGEKLRQLRADSSIRELTSALGITYQSYWNYENGSQVPRDDIKLKIAQYYGLTVDEIFFAQPAHGTCECTQEEVKA